MDDYVAIARTARASGVRVVFLGYPARAAVFDPYTLAMQRTAAQEHVAFVDAIAAIAAMPPEQRTWTFGLHAGPTGLTRIAEELAIAIRTRPSE
jgi:hypothetical protein